MKTLSFAVAGCVLALLSLQASAAIGVGSSVSDISYTSAQGGKVNIGALKGKLVLIDFWATWCVPCMHEAPHMVQINQKYASKGLVVLGISLDQDAATMLAGAKGAGLTWPQVIDGGKYSQMFGVDSIPRTFLVGPDGKVLWTGHPASGLDAAIDDAFKNHPPFLVDPAIVADATKLLEQAEAKIEAKDPKSAMKLLSKVPPAAKQDETFAARQKDVEKKLTDAAEGMLGEVEPLVTAGNYPEAISKLRDLSEGLAGSPAGAKAKKELADLMTKPEAKAALAKADKEARQKDTEAKAAEALAEATKLQSASQDAQAYAAFKSVAATYAGTPSGETAAAQVKAYDAKDPTLASKAGEAAAAGKARGLLSLAETYERQGDVGKARAKYQSVIDAFPGTSYAKKAQDRITALAGQ
ncbi:MAG TPA: redoxin family protein [Tepidisphaeraceae bacterium]|nr:redoxin family protein [Tepidisphaeraceae bacterium]